MLASWSILGYVRALADLRQSTLAIDGYLLTDGLGGATAIVPESGTAAKSNE